MFNLRRFDVQARVSVIASALSLLVAGMMIPMVFKHFHRESLMIYYSPKTSRELVIFITALVAIAFGVCGCGFGFNSAGQRRNDKQGLSWIGFFLGPGAITVTCLLLSVFWFGKENVVMM